MQEATPTSKTARVSWLGRQASFTLGTTFGLPWSRGDIPQAAAFTCSDSTGQEVALQSWSTGYWPDGSIKWTAHAIPAAAAVTGDFFVHANKQTTGTGISTASPENAAPWPRTTTQTSSDGIFVDTGKIRVNFADCGNALITQVATRHGRVVGKNGRLVLLAQPIPSNEEEFPGKGAPTQSFTSVVDSIAVDQDGPVRVVIVVRGKHHLDRTSNPPTADQPGAWLPFVVRLYLYAGSDAIRVVHTLVYDGDPARSFIRGIGLRFDVPLHGSELHDRHIRIAGVDGGVLSEAVQGITGLWHGPGPELCKLQVRGKPLPPSDQWDPDGKVRTYVPSWNDYSLNQLSADGFTLKKRTKPGHSWVSIPGGTRAGGFAYLGSATGGGLAVGLRHFWERHPTALDIRNAATDTGEITTWLYSPSAEPMDLRPYHDGLGQDTFRKQLDALKITYEDWEPSLGSPYGIARTNEISLHALDHTPEAPEVSRLTDHIRNSPVLIATPEYMHETSALGQYWSPLKGDFPSSPADFRTITKNRLDFLFQYYKEQISQRRWYGFWDHGDVMHTYDADRHTWRYDVGGFAWDNSELSPDLWLWLYFLSTGREDVFRVAEALTRHTGEVDVYHLGKYKGIGTRHGVQHWSDSCKQARVSNALYRRIFYFVSGGDERTGELLEETLEAEKAFLTIDPYRKVRVDASTYKADPEAVAISLGTDWSALAASWFIEWERQGSQWSSAKTKLLQTMTGIGRLKNGFVTGNALYNTKTGQISPPVGSENAGAVTVSHLSAMFGLVEVCAELINTLGADLPDGFEQAWLDYCRYFNASQEEQAERYSVSFGHKILRQGHSRLTAYAAARLGNEKLAERAWHEFKTGDGYDTSTVWETQLVPTSYATSPQVEEAPWVSTNITSLYGLAAIQNLALLSNFRDVETLE